MNTIDLAILILLAVFTLLGLMRGFIQEMGSLVGMFIGFFIAGKFAWPVAQYIRGGFAQYPTIADPLSYIVGFFIVFFVATFIFGLLVKTLDKVFNLFVIFPFLKAINRLGGAVVGLIEGVFFVTVAVYMLASLPMITGGLSNRIHGSVAGPFFEGLAVTVKPLLPDFKTLDLTKLLKEAHITVPAGTLPAPTTPAKK